MKVWELGKGRNQSRWMMAVVPDQSKFPFPALQYDPLTSINSATAYYRRSDFMNSREQWDKARESLSKDPYPLYSLAMVGLREGKAEEAEAYALKALDLDAKSAYAHDVLGLAYANQGKNSTKPCSPSARLSGLALVRNLSESIIYRSGLSILKEPGLKTIKKKENPNEKTSQGLGCPVDGRVRLFLCRRSSRTGRPTGRYVNSGGDQRARCDHGFRCRGRALFKRSPDYHNCLCGDLSGRISSLA